MPAATMTYRCVTPGPALGAMFDDVSAYIEAETIRTGEAPAVMDKGGRIVDLGTGQVVLFRGFDLDGVRWEPDAERELNGESVIVTAIDVDGTVTMTREIGGREIETTARAIEIVGTITGPLSCPRASPYDLAAGESELFLGYPLNSGRSERDHDRAPVLVRFWRIERNGRGALAMHRTHGGDQTFGRLDTPSPEYVEAFAWFRVPERGALKLF